MHKKKPFILAIFFVVLILVLYKTANIYPFLFHLIFDRNISLKETDSKINILLLGIGGGNHEGPNLTDTIILATVDQKNSKVTLSSIPRDLWIPDLNGEDKKINSAYAYGESVRKGGGLVLSKAVVKKVTGQEVDYGVRIDFSGFVKAVDIIGGLDVSVENTFDDYEYPISGKEDDPCGKTEDELQGLATASAEQQVTELSCRYKHLHFDKGVSHMNGETALEYVRSRHAKGVEGTDFARSKRQEKVINAFKDKLFSAQTLINPAKIIGLYSVISGSIDTDIKQEEFDDFVRLAQKMKGSTIQSAVIDIGDEESKRQGLLFHPPITEEYNYEWVLIPLLGNGDFSAIQKYVSCEIEIGNCDISRTSN